VTTSVALMALRVWWALVLVMTVVGAAVGLLAVRNAPYQAVTSLRVDTAGFAEVAQESIVQTSRLLVDSDRMYAKVVGNDPIAIDELRSRTTVDIVLTSSVLQITVTAKTAAQAEHDVDAIAKASINNVQELAEIQFNSIVKNGQDALATGKLVDPVAEQARRDAVGKAIAAQQDNALRLSAQLSRIGAVLPATPVGLSRTTAMLLGAVAGGVAGALLALFLGPGRRRISRPAHLRVLSQTLVPSHPVAAEDVGPRVASEASRISHALVVVLALPKAERILDLVAGDILRELHADGSRAFVLGDEDVRRTASLQEPETSALGSRALPGGPALGLPRRRADLEAAAADVLFVSGRADEYTLGTVAARADIVVLVGRYRQTSVRALAAAADQLGSSQLPLVVFLSGRDAAGRSNATTGSLFERLARAPFGRTNRDTRLQAPATNLVVDHEEAPAAESVPTLVEGNAAGTTAAAAPKTNGHPLVTDNGHEPLFTDDGYEPLFTANGHEPSASTNGHEPPAALDDGGTVAHITGDTAAAVVEESAPVSLAKGEPAQDAAVTGLLTDNDHQDPPPARKPHFRPSPRPRTQPEEHAKDQDPRDGAPIISRPTLTEPAGSRNA
jgi:hypothetical protein